MVGPEFRGEPGLALEQLMTTHGRATRSNLIRRLTDPVLGIKLNSWIDADGNSHGQANTFMRF
jgi:hypothetical protein